MSEAWRGADLGSLSSLITSGSRGWAEFYAETGPAFLRITNLTRSAIWPDLSDLKRVQLPNNQAEGSRTRVRTGDVLISITADLGIIGVAPDLGEAYVNQHIALVRPTAEMVPEFVGYYLAGPGQAQFLRLNDGGAKAGLNLASIRRLRMLVPPRSEQRKIAAILLSVDDAIKATHAVIDQLGVVKKAMLAELFTRGVPGRHTRFRSTVLGEVPESWAIVPLMSHLEQMTDYVANGSFQSLRENVTVLREPAFAYYVRLFDLRRGLGHPEQTYVDESTYKFLAKSSLRGGEVLIANIGANVGDVFLMRAPDRPATIAPNMIVMRPSAGTSCEFLHAYLDSAVGKGQVESAVGGSGQPKLSKTDLKRVLTLRPPFEEQQEIAAVSGRLDERIVSELDLLGGLSHVKAALMSVLLTGDVRVICESGMR